MLDEHELLYDMCGVYFVIEGGHDGDCALSGA
jgi:hypothetical protein